MSNSLAIATVTAALSRKLQQALDTATIGAVAGAEVKPGRPGVMGPTALTRGIHVYLLQVTPNAAYRNADLPTRNQRGELVKRPQVALDLHYLLSFHGEEALLEPQRMLGIAAIALHSQPVLTREFIRETLADAINGPLLAGSDLADQIEHVRFTPSTVNLEELSKIWSVFFQTTHVLSAIFQASVVLLEAEEIPAAPLPVRERGIYVEVMRQSRITALVQPIVTLRDRLVLLGTELGNGTEVRFGSGEVVTPDEAANDRIEVTLPRTLRAGPNTVAVVHTRRMANGSAPPRMVSTTSNVVAFVLAPRIVMPSPVLVARSGVTITLSVEPAVGRNQRAAILIGTRRIPVSIPRDTTDGVETLAAEIPTDIAPGAYPLRVEVNGIASLLEDDASPGRPGIKPFIEIRGGE